MAQFTYNVEATVWSSGGTGKSWRGQAIIGQRADSKAGLDALQAAVRTQAEAWLRTQGQTPSGHVDLTNWAPRAR